MINPYIRLFIFQIVAQNKMPKLCDCRTSGLVIPEDTYLHKLMHMVEIFGVEEAEAKGEVTRMEEILLYELSITA